MTEITSDRMFHHATSQTNVTLFSLNPYNAYSIAIAAVTVAPGPASEPLFITTHSDGKFLEIIQNMVL